MHPTCAASSRGKRSRLTIRVNARSVPQARDRVKKRGLAFPGHGHFLRRIDEVALDEFDAELPQHGHRIRILDAFADRDGARLARDLDQLAHALLLQLVGGEALHQRAVDLHEVGLQVGDLALRVPPGTHALDRAAETELLQSLAGRDRLHLLEEADSDAVVLVNPDNPPDGGAFRALDVEVRIDLAASMDKSEVLMALDNLKRYIAQDTWPPA